MALKGPPGGEGWWFVFCPVGHFRPMMFYRVSFSSFPNIWRQHRQQKKQAHALTVPWHMMGHLYLKKSNIPNDRLTYTIIRTGGHLHSSQFHSRFCMSSQYFEALSGWCISMGPPPSAVLLVWRAASPVLPPKFSASIASLVVVSHPSCKATSVALAWCQMTARKSSTCNPVPLLPMPHLPSLSCCWPLSWNNFLSQNVFKSVVVTIFHLSLSRAGLPSLPPFITWNSRQLNKRLLYSKYLKETFVLNWKIQF